MLWAFQAMEDRLHELMTAELAIYWGLGRLTRLSPISTNEASHVSVGAIHTFLNYSFPLGVDDEDIPLKHRMSYVEGWGSNLKALSDQFS
jgi:hypothetical protein